MRSIRRAFPDMFEQPEGYVPPDDLPSFASVEHPYFEEGRNRRLSSQRDVMELLDVGYGKELSQLAGILRDGYTEMNRRKPRFNEPYDEDAYRHRIMQELEMVALNEGVPVPESIFAR